MKKSRTNASPKADATELSGTSFCAWEGETLVLNILGTPSAKKDAIGKPKGNQLKVSVTAAPVAGKATDQMVKFLAREFDVSTADITVVFGRFNINKQLRIKSPQKLPTVVANALSVGSKELF
jgi:uncharacterized protein (TIGR00251 family)